MGIEEQLLSVLPNYCFQWSAVLGGLYTVLARYHHSKTAIIQTAVGYVWNYSSIKEWLYNDCTIRLSYGFEPQCLSQL